MRQLSLVILFSIMLFSITVTAQNDTDENPCELIPTSQTTEVYFVGLGDAYFAEANYNLAITMYTCAIDLNPEYAPAYVNRGYAHAVQANTDLALEDYNQALQINPDLVSGYTNRGVLYTSLGSFAQALADFDLTTALNPDYVPAYYNRAIVHAAEGNYDLAIADLNTALEIDPEFAEAHAVMGAVHLALALESYDTFQDIAGELAVPPGVSARFMLDSLQEGFAAESFTPWLPLQIPGR